MAEARNSFFDFDVTKMMADFRFRPFDVEALMASQRRNIEALTQANQLAVEGVQAVARRQIVALSRTTRTCCAAASVAMARKTTERVAVFKSGRWRVTRSGF